MSIRNRFSSRWLACFVAGWLCLMTLQSDGFAHCGANCGCNATREIHPPMAPACACNCGCKKAPKVNCLKKAMDNLKVGFDKLFSFRKSSCDELLCDDACDAAMIEELMLPPMASPSHKHNGHAHPHQDAPSIENLPPQIEEVKPMTPPVRLQEPPAEPEGSLFDTDEDPFSDDEARTGNYRPIRPSAYQKVELRPIRKQPVPRQSSRRSSSSR